MRYRALMMFCVVLVLSVLLAACGIGSGNDPTATSTSEPVASPTISASPTGSPSAGPTQSGITTVFTPEETALLEVLLKPDDLQGDWSQQSVDAPENTGQPGVCGVAPFAGQTQATATVKSEYQSGDGSSFIVEQLDQYPERVARDAFTYLQNASTCTEFTDPQGLKVSVSPAQAPTVGDEAFAIGVSIATTSGSTLTGQFIYVRTGPLLATISYLTVGDFRPDQAATIASAASEKMTAVTSGEDQTTTRVAQLLDGLLALSDFPSGWQPLGSAGPADPADWVPLCGAQPFTDQAKAIGRVSADFFSGAQSRAASVQQVLQEYPADIAPQAYAWQRDAAGCGSWNQGGTQINLQPTDLPTFGDESLAVKFSYTDANGQPVEGVWVEMRVGNVLSTLIYTDPQGADLALAQQIANAAVSRIQALPPA